MVYLHCQLLVLSKTNIGYQNIILIFLSFEKGMTDGVTVKHNYTDSGPRLLAETLS